MRGRRNYFSGVAAENSVAQMYQRKGAAILGQRVRTPEGELDLVARMDDILVFIEVKKRSRSQSCDSPISCKQWYRLEKAALHYMMEYQKETGIQPFCRFDVALAGRVYCKVDATYGAVAPGDLLTTSPTAGM